MKFTVGHRLAGISHIKKGTDCQDYFSYQKTEAAIIAAVADGVGSEEHSAFGSKIVCEKAVAYCAENITLDMRDKDVLRVIASSFNESWQEVENCARENDIDVQQCNTTLSLAVYIDGRVFYGHIGDSGIFAFFDDGKIAPVTTPQNDDEGRVFTLSSGPLKWQYGKADKKAVSLLLCTDGIWNLFFTERLAQQEEKYAVHLLHFYLNPDTIYQDYPEEDLQKWLEDDMEGINKNHSANVNFDDITMIIVCDKQIPFTRQPDDYYKKPTKEELEKAYLEELERLYGHLSTDADENT